MADDDILLPFSKKHFHYNDDLHTPGEPINLDVYNKTKSYAQVATSVEQKFVQRMSGGLKPNKIRPFHIGIRLTPKEREIVVQQAEKWGLQELARLLQGSICIIGAKHGNLSSTLGSSLVNVGFLWVEPNDLPHLKALLNLISNGDASRKAEAAFSFIGDAFTGLGSCKDFVEGILKGTLRRRPNETKRKALHNKHQGGYSHELLLDVINYILSEGIKCKKIESTTYLRKILEQHIETNKNIMEIFSKEIAYRKVLGKRSPKRCIGTTLLLKGLEFDHAIILYNQNDNGWSPKDLYVAITRGCQSVYLLS